ncbi:NAD(P)H-dependent oxidoreductase [Vibrio parahaemolyticus]|uniref:flavodoxin family protein n=1 Tax=Vibrio parahaemolyticus TaxID=670 RepID=UPI00111EDBFD|nr:NAD(P)H-dependent oxidoreductase [Vibrio parahaemolyticus]EGR3223608.1 NADPH-dependent oxidoreductase [Vibrio parahaemolyticus]EHW0655828.1 NAD(P)H-dependent oxidoreductase [Vibrio parahaemolyticus]MBE3696230.1 NAD(P)H-dependent oxidoreductase [Vibrio parahaemolyticus]MBM4873904.1 NAD(P)H-dependent oxidoreductase [Vibrio parahaemolyticus]MCR9808307.1 NAD(P)H-dependent oxidoreductase [Vibrio parahaemolyticus]
MNIAVILGTSKSDGNTRKLADSFVEQSGAKLFDLSNFNVSFYDYSHENENDDFLPIIHELLSFDHLVFASPVYWYSMSAQLKVFFDRLSDLLTIEKELGRRLKGKSISVLSTGYNVELPDCFVQPFELTAKYMQLEFKGCEYLAIQTESDLGKVTISAAQAIENVT